jgi:hypothetical protein
MSQKQINANFNDSNAVGIETRVRFHSPARLIIMDLQSSAVKTVSTKGSNLLCSVGLLGWSNQSTIQDLPAKCSP